MCAATSGGDANGDIAHLCTRRDACAYGGGGLDGGVAAPATVGFGKAASLDSRAASALSRLAGSDAAALPNLEFGSSPVTELMAQEMARLGAGSAAGMDLWELFYS